MKLGNCYRDSINARVLNGRSKVFDDNTPEKCRQFCKKEGFDVSGVQFARECFCGNSMPKDDLKLTSSSSCHPLEQGGLRSKKVSRHSSINPNLYLDYGNMIHFAVLTALAS